MISIDVVAYDPLWPRQFTEERARLAGALDEVARRIDHNGSTAVPGLAGKPIIDIQVSVADLRPIDAYRAALQRLGYTHVPHEDDARCPFFHQPSTWPHTHHVHVVEFGSDEEKRTLAFRDYLRDHPAIAAEYARLRLLKLWLAQKFAADDPAAREAYATAKGGFVEPAVAAALAAGYPR